MSWNAVPPNPRDAGEPSVPAPSPVPLVSAPQIRGLLTQGKPSLQGQSWVAPGFEPGAAEVHAGPGDSPGRPADGPRRPGLPFSAPGSKPGATHGCA
jgi:hypothetical protein